MFISISGSRNINDYERIANILDQYDITEINVGDCRGLDAIVIRYCKNKNIKCNVFKADWNQYGKRAGPIRNQQLIIGTEMLIAFPCFDSIGTINSIKIAEKMKIECDTHLIN